jgi:hypothetical protein
VPPWALTYSFAGSDTSTSTASVYVAVARSSLVLSGLSAADWVKRGVVQVLRRWPNTSGLTTLVGDPAANELI